MKSIFDNGTVVFLLVVVVAKIVEAVVKSRKAKQQHEAARDPAEEQRRVAEVQEQIRRRIAERRGGGPPASPGTEPHPRPVVRRADPTSVPDPFGGALRRVLEEVERKIQPPPAPVPEPPPLVQAQRGAELERQQQLADQMRSLAEAKVLTQRRAAHAADDIRAEAESEPGLRSAARTRILEDLRDPHALRRAFVLREVLGTPVGLR